MPPARRLFRTLVRPHPVAFRAGGARPPADDRGRRRCRGRTAGRARARCYRLETFSAAEVGAALEIIRRYGGLEIGLADASIVVLASKYGVREVLTLDERHFRALRTSTGRSFGSCLRMPDAKDAKMIYCTPCSIASCTCQAVAATASPVFSWLGRCLSPIGNCRQRRWVGRRADTGRGAKPDSQDQHDCHECSHGGGLPAGRFRCPRDIRRSPWRGTHYANAQSTSHSSYAFE